jgi:Ca2+-binding EF-hand superfamily protein
VALCVRCVVRASLFLGQAFAELDTDGDGIIKGEEFAAIPKSDKFNKVTRAEMVRACW